MGQVQQWVLDCANAGYYHSYRQIHLGQAENRQDEQTSCPVLVNRGKVDHCRHCYVRIKRKQGPNRIAERIGCTRVGIPSQQTTRCARFLEDFYDNEFEISKKTSDKNLNRRYTVSKDVFAIMMKESGLNTSASFIILFRSTSRSYFIFNITLEEVLLLALSFSCSSFTDWASFHFL